MNRTLSALLGALLFLSANTAGLAQGTAEISGTVRDQSGAVLPGAELSATQIQTGFMRNAITNETGFYTLPNLPVGPYKLEVSLPGFRTYVQTGLILEVNSRPVINVALEIGQVTEQVEVQANAAMVETRSVGVGQVVENARILELPLNGRQVTDLIVLSGAAVAYGALLNQAYLTMNSAQISVAGGVNWGVSYMLDGTLYNDPSESASLPLPFPDALQEFKIETSSLTAQNGMHAGAAVNAVTKSGTNQIHGDLFEFVRNDLFNARNYFALKQSTLKRNQFGGTLGMPLVKNKLFFFGGYQATRVRQDPGDTISFIPTAAMLSGDFTAFTAPACNGSRQINLAQPYSNNRIDPGMFSKAALNIARQLPQTADPCGRIVWGSRNIQDVWQGVGKIDYQLSEKHSLFARYVPYYDNTPVPYTLSKNLLTANDPGLVHKSNSYAFGSNYVVNANTVNSLRFAVNQTFLDRRGAEFFSAPDIGVKAYSYVPHFMNITMAGGFGIGSAGPINITTHSWQIAEDVSVVRGTHQMAFGVNLAPWKYHLISNMFSVGNYNFSGQATGAALADFLVGSLNTLTQSAPTDARMGQWYIGTYAQDTWKATRTLTVSYGIRWEPFLPQYSENGRIYHFDVNAFRQGIHTAQFKNAPPGLFYPGDAGFPDRSGMSKQWWDFSPRLGLAWDPQGNGKTSVRASVGTAYEFMVGDLHYQTAISAPWGDKQTLQSVRLDDPYAGNNPFPITVNADAIFPPYGNFNTMNYDTHTTRVGSWNLSVQRQLSTNWLVSASYLGRATRHLWGGQELNPAQFLGLAPCALNGVNYSVCSATTNTNQRRLFTLQNAAAGAPFGYVTQIDDGGIASYHGLVLSAQHRASRGVAMNANYTFSRCISDPYIKQPNGGSAGSVYQNVANRSVDRGNCDSDRRHIVNFTAVLDSPRFSNRTLRLIGTGWKLAPLYRISSGSWLTVTSGRDSSLTGIPGQRPNQALSNVYGDRSSLTRFLNPAAFAQPAPGTFGNVGAFTVLGPVNWQFDAALSRTFDVRETQHVEFRAEVYNVTNSLRRGNPNLNLTQGTFGQITTALDPRIMQFALKYLF